MSSLVGGLSTRISTYHQDHHEQILRATHGTHRTPLSYPLFRSGPHLSVGRIDGNCPALQSFHGWCSVGYGPQHRPYHCNWHLRQCRTRGDGQSSRLFRVGCWLSDDTSGSMDHVESLPSPQGLPGRLDAAGEGEFLGFPRPAAVW
jgi:hypothetical protein